jgi:ribosome-binding factor A
METTMASPEGTRAAKVSDRIREELMNMILRGDVHDPDVAGCVVSAVTVTRDLSLARVYVRLLETDPSEARQLRLVKALGRAQPFIRREIARRVALRRAPDLRFAWDDVADRASRVEELLHDVSLEKTGESAKRGPSKGRGE